MTPLEFALWESDAPGIDFKPVYVDVAGDLIAGVLLSQIIYWYLPSKKKGTSKLRIEPDDSQWIIKTKQQWYQETRLTEKRFDRALDILIAKGIIKVRWKKWKGSQTTQIQLELAVFLEGLEKVLDPSNFSGLETDKKAFSKRTKRPFRYHQKG